MNKIKNIIKRLGPGFITGASDDDPSGIITYSQTGALFGFGQAWTAPFSFPFMTVVQEMCGRIGLVTGRGIAGVIKIHYSKALLYFVVSLLFIANTINIGADLGAMAASASLIFGLPSLFWLFVIVVVTLALEVYIPYKKYVSYLKYLTFALFSYVFTAFIVNVDWAKVLTATVIPSVQLSKDYLFNIVAVLGTTISPYLFFWQASEEVEEEVVTHKLRSMGAGVPKITSRDLSTLRKDTLIGMLFSNLVMWFIIVTTGATLFPAGIHTITSASQASLALRPLAGEFTFILFSLGIIGTGFLAIPILSGSASYAVSEVFGWREGLYKKLFKAPGFYGIIVVATLIGSLINLIGINPMSALYYTAVINGIIAPPLLIVIFVVANNKAIMGERINGLISNVLSIIIIAIMSICSVVVLLNILKII